MNTRNRTPLVIAIVLVVVAIVAIAVVVSRAAMTTTRRRNEINRWCDGIVEHAPRDL